MVGPEPGVLHRLDKDGADLVVDVAAVGRRFDEGRDVARPYSHVELGVKAGHIPDKPPRRLQALLRDPPGDREGKTARERGPLPVARRQGRPELRVVEVAKLAP